MVISKYNQQQLNIFSNLTLVVFSFKVWFKTPFYKDGLPTSIFRTGLCLKGHSGNTARGCQLVGRPFLFGKKNKLYNKGINKNA